MQCMTRVPTSESASAIDVKKTREPEGDQVRGGGSRAGISEARVCRAHYREWTKWE